MRPLNKIQTSCQTAISVGGLTARWFYIKVPNLLLYVNFCEKNTAAQLDYTQIQKGLMIAAWQSPVTGVQFTTQSLGRH